MKDSFIPDDLQNANQSLMKKIEYLTIEKSKADMYIKDLEQSLKINKEAVRVINAEGPNDPAVKLLTRQSQLLQVRLRKAYNQNRDLNALLLFESQIRIQDKSFYQERVVEFENRISDLRKYLHDKEDSFSNVVNRLKKYEDINELMLSDKMASLRTQFMGSQSQVNSYGVGQEGIYGSATGKQIVARLSQQRNMFKRKFQEALQELAYLKGQEKGLPDQPHNNNKTQGLSKTDTTNNITIKSENPKVYPINPNKELVRLLKKQKISNQILQQALNQAIEKNEELVSYNQRLFQANQSLEEIASQLRAYIVKLEGRLADFEQNYQRKREGYMSRCDVDLECFRQRRLSRKFDYEDKNFRFEEIMPKGQLMKMKRDIERLAMFMPKPKPVVLQNRKGMNQKMGSEPGEEEQRAKIQLAKSGSEPKLSKEQLSDQQIEIDYL